MVSGGTVTGDLSSVKNNMTKINSEITGLSGSWKGSSYDNLVSKLDQAITEINGILESEMNAFASACDLYQEYEQTKSLLSSAKSSSDPNTSSQADSYQRKLNELKSQIESLLSTAGATTIQSSAASTLTTSTDLSSLGTPTFGSFEEKSFKASNGLVMKYYLYRPNYNGNLDVEGLPVMLYMHGGGSNNSYSSLLARGLSKELRQKTINPSGICIIPFIQNFTDKRTIPALKELCDQVVSDTKADQNRISVSGHSYGGITTYRLINSYPGYFAAAVPISGFDKVTDAFKYTRIWGFNGELDTGGNTGNAGHAKAINQINQIGGNAYFYSYKGAGHGYVQDYTYEREFTSPDGDVTTPLEWAFRQKRQNVQA